MTFPHKVAQEGCGCLLLQYFEKLDNYRVRSSENSPKMCFTALLLSQRIYQSSLLLLCRGSYLGDRSQCCTCKLPDQQTHAIRQEQIMQHSAEYRYLVNVALSHRATAQVTWAVKAFNLSKPILLHTADKST